MAYEYKLMTAKENYFRKYPVEVKDRFGVFYVGSFYDDTQSLRCLCRTIGANDLMLGQLSRDPPRSEKHLENLFADAWKDSRKKDRSSLDIPEQPDKISAVVFNRNFRYEQAACVMAFINQYPQNETNKYGTHMFHLQPAVSNVLFLGVSTVPTKAGVPKTSQISAVHLNQILGAYKLDAGCLTNLILSESAEDVTTGLFDVLLEINGKGEKDPAVHLLRNQFNDDKVIKHILVL